MADLTTEERIQWLHEQTVQAAAEIDCDLVPSEKNSRAWRMVRRTSTDTAST